MSIEPQTHSSFALTCPEASAKPVNLLRRVIACWWIAFAGSSIFVVAGHLLIKKGLNATAATVVGDSLLSRLLHAALQFEVVTGLAIYCLGSVCWMIAVAQQEISFLYPLSSVNYLLVMATSSLLFHEIVSFRRAAGVAVIVLGMFLMSRNGRSAAQ